MRRLSEIARIIAKEQGWHDVLGGDTDMYVRTLVTYIAAGNNYLIKRVNELSK